MMNLDLTGKRAVVCGSSQGIGLAIAKELSGLGASITMLARDERRMSLAIKELDNSKGQDHHQVVIDFGQPDEVRSVMRNYAQYNPKIHILVNNSGGPKPGSILDIGADEFKEAFLQHLISDHALAKIIVPKMIVEGYGRIINILSVSVKEPIRGLGVSNSVRAAVANWAKTLSDEVGPYGITVNNVLPGPTNTNRIVTILEAHAKRQNKDIETVKEEMLLDIPLKRFATAEEIAYAVAFLASPAASYINGINLPVDGGKLGCL